MKEFTLIVALTLPILLDLDLMSTNIIIAIFLWASIIIKWLEVK